MYKLCFAFAALLAVAAAKPSLGFTYGSYVTPVATSYSYSAPVYSAPVYPNYAGVAPVATTYAAAPVAAVATAPVATYPAAYPAYPSYTAPLTYASEIPTSFLWKKK